MNEIYIQISCKYHDLAQKIRNTTRFHTESELWYTYTEVNWLAEARLKQYELKDVIGYYPQKALKILEEELQNGI